MYSFRDQEDRLQLWFFFLERTSTTISSVCETREQTWSGLLFFFAKLVAHNAQRITHARRAREHSEDTKMTDFTFPDFFDYPPYFT